MLANLLSGAVSHVAAVNCHPTFLGLKSWNYYLPMDPNNNCGFDASYPFYLLPVPGHQSALVLILLAVIDDLLIIAGMVAVIFVIYAAIKFITSEGDAQGAHEARSTLQDSLIGLILVGIAIPTVSFLGNALGGNYSAGTTGRGLDLSALPVPAGVDTGQPITTLISIAYNIVGALALLYVVIGGLRYATSGGDPGKMGKAKNSIVFALVGLAIAVLAGSIVSFVYGRVVP